MTAETDSLNRPQLQELRQPRRQHVRLGQDVAGLGREIGSRQGVEWKLIHSRWQGAILNSTPEAGS
jgi:hypothetical protein